MLEKVDTISIVDYTKVNTKRDSFNSTDDESNSISVSEE